MAAFDQFIHQYQVSKTLRFALIPQGKTLENITKNNVLKEDDERQKNYEKVKPILDRIYKVFAEESLKNCSVDWNDLDACLDAYQKNPSADKRQKVKDAQDALRDEIAGYFTGKQYADGKNKDAVKEKEQAELYKDIFSKKLFDGTVTQLPLSPKEKKLLGCFDKFTTYFVGFYQNRENVFSGEDIATAIPHRIVQDNFPKFRENCRIYQNLIKNETALKPLLQQAAVAVMAQNPKGIFQPGILLDDIFVISFYNHLLLQDDIDYFNQILGGISGDAGQKKIQGLNETINLFMQQNPQKADKLKKIPHRFIPLYKQILSDRTSFSFIPKAFADSQEALNGIKTFKESLKKNDTFGALERLIQNLASLDLGHVYLSNKKINEISQALYEEWHCIQDVLKQHKINDILSKQGKVTAKSEKTVREWMKQDFSLELLIQIIPQNPSNGFLASLTAEGKKRISQCRTVLGSPLPVKLADDQEKAQVKNQLDTLLDAVHYLEWFKADTDLETDPNFTVPFEKIWEELVPLLSLYSKVRNFVTKKPYSTEKFKLNFANPTLADGWDIHKESDNGALLFEKGGLYYLGIMNPKDKPDFKSYQGVEPYYQKMVYRFFPDCSKTIPKCSTQRKDVKKYFEGNPQAASYQICDPKKEKFRQGFFQIPREIYELNNTTYGTGKSKYKKFQTQYYQKTKDQAGYQDALCKWIDFSKDFLQTYTSTSIFDFKGLRPSKDYQDLGEFYKDVNSRCYRVTFEKIREKDIHDAVNKGQLYLFQLYNKDFSPKSHGLPNLHTLYWKAVFDPENLKDPIVKLNGQAELFYRPKSNMQVIQHKAGEDIVNKKLKDGTPVPDDIYREISGYVQSKYQGILSPETQKWLPLVTIKKAAYDITKDRRFTEDKFFFHVPITLNYQNPDKPRAFNPQVNDFLTEHPETNIIGIDRGERNLIYAVVMTPEGKILEQKSFNVIHGFNYHESLTQREKQRVAARQAWTAIGRIKDLKEGYLSQVVHKITQMMIKYQAVVVLENLNTGFKRVRGGISEKAVYQQFEKMLIEKLNFLVFKDRAMDQEGGVLKAYQLTDSFTSFAKLGNQSGFLFYIPSAYTSKIDPTTGFVDPFIWGHVTASEQARNEFLEGFDSLKYVAKYSAFVLHFNMKNNKKFQKNNVEGFMPEWDICFEKNEEKISLQGEKYMAGKRIFFDSQKKQYVERCPQNELVEALQQANIPWVTGDDILPAVLSQASTDTGFRHRMVDLIRSVLQMRNSNGATGEDYINSPVMDLDGHFFDTRAGIQNLPLDADANGAYHIALKGKLLLERIRNGKNTAIKNTDWLYAIQEERN